MTHPAVRSTTRSDAVGVSEPLVRRDSTAADGAADGPGVAVGVRVLPSGWARVAVGRKGGGGEAGEEDERELNFGKR